MIISDISSIKVIEYIEVRCDNCPVVYTRTLKNVRASRKRHDGKDLCSACSHIKAASKRKQNTKEYWENENIKNKHSVLLKKNKKFQEFHKNIDRSGENNGMYGKKASLKTRNKMSISRKGKKQSKETIEKRQKTFQIKRKRKLEECGFFNLNKEIRWYIHKQIGWYKKVYERDGFKCIKCSSKNKIDAHHKKSLNSIILELTIDKNFINDFDKYKFLIQQPEILDPDLKNGETLCRKCHKEVHNWGSHKC